MCKSSVDDAGLVARDKRTAPLRQRHENGGRCEIEVGPFRVRAVRLVLQPACRDVGILRGHLMRPQHPARVEIHRDERVARRRRRIAVVVARGDVQRVTDLVHHRARPDWRTRWSPELGAARIPANRSRLVHDGVAFPDLSARRRIESDDAAAKAAALVVRQRSDAFLAGRDRHIEPSAMENGRSGDAGHGEALHADLPDQPPGRRIDGVGVAARVAEKGRVVPWHVRPSPHADGRAHDGAGIEGPVDASRSCIQRVDVAGDAASEDTPAHERDGGPRLHVARQPEGPLELQARDIGRGELGPTSFLEACVRQVLPESVPDRRRGLDRKGRARPAHRAPRRARW